MSLPPFEKALVVPVQHQDESVAQRFDRFGDGAAVVLMIGQLLLRSFAGLLESNRVSILPACCRQYVASGP